ncbi:MAG: hypothetical protein ABFE07_14055 [Armatimonadia bacterium]
MWRLLVLLSGVAAVSSALAAPVLSEDFERGQGEWRFSATRGNVSGVLDSTEPAGGHSLRLDVTDPAGRATWTYGPKIALKPSTAYRLQVKVMRVAVQPGGRAYLILYEDGIEAPSHWHNTAYMSGTQDWQTQTVDFKTKPETSWARLQVKLWEATGYAWFDDVTIEELPAGTPPVEVTQGQRQPPADDGSPLQLMWYPAHRRPDCTLHLLPGLVNPVSMFFWGRKDEVKDPHLVIETPLQVKITGPVTCSRETIPEPVTLTPEKVMRDGQAALRWRVPVREAELVKRLKPGGPEWTAYHFVYVEPQTGCPQSFQWRWRTESSGQLGPEHEIAARLEPVKPGKLARVAQFPLYAQHSDALRLPTKQARRAVLDYLNYAAIEGGLSLGSYQPEYAPIDRELGQAGFFTWAWLWDGYNQAGGGDFPLVMDTGKADNGKMCTQAQVERAEPWWGLLKETYKQRLSLGATMLIINYEPPVFNCCFCDRCRAAFAAQAKLPLEQVKAMTPLQIQQLPDNVWGHFRAWQNGQIVKNHANAIHAVNPKVRLGLCGPPYSEWIANRGMDIRLFEPEVAFHAPMIYEVGTQYAGPTRETCEQTKAPVIPFVLASDLAVPHVFPTAEQLRVNLLATAASGGKGAVLWVGIESLDGEFMNALRQAIGEIALMQPYLTGGKRIDGPKLDVARQQVRPVKVGEKTFEVSPQNSGIVVWQWAWQSPKGHMALLANYETDNPQHVRLTGEGIEKAKTLFGVPVTPGQGQATVVLPPGALTAITW